MIWVNVGGCAVDQASMVVLHAHDETRAKKVSDGIPRGETVLTGDLSRIAQTKALWSTWSARIAGFDANHPQCRCRLPRAETNDGLPAFSPSNAVVSYHRLLRRGNLREVAKRINNYHYLPNNPRAIPPKN
jgi:hypothetical protein